MQHSELRCVLLNIKNKCKFQLSDANCVASVVKLAPGDTRTWGGVLCLFGDWVTKVWTCHKKSQECRVQQHQQWSGYRPLIGAVLDTGIWLVCRVQLASTVTPVCLYLVPGIFTNKYRQDLESIGSSLGVQWELVWARVRGILILDLDLNLELRTWTWPWQN